MSLIRLVLFLLVFSVGNNPSALTMCEPGNGCFICEEVTPTSYAHVWAHLSGPINLIPNENHSELATAHCTWIGRFKIRVSYFVLLSAFTDNVSGRCHGI